MPLQLSRGSRGRVHAPEREGECYDYDREFGTLNRRGGRAWRVAGGAAPGPVMNNADVRFSTRSFSRRTMRLYTACEACYRKEDFDYYRGAPQARRRHGPPRVPRFEARGRRAPRVGDLPQSRHVQRKHLFRLVSLPPRHVGHRARAPSFDARARTRTDEKPRTWHATAPRRVEGRRTKPSETSCRPAK